jgi:mono/diheme cytochrome c family protein
MRATAVLTILLFVSAAVTVVLLGNTGLTAQEPGQQQQQAQEEQEEQEAPEAAVPLVIPEEEKKRQNPFEVDDEFVALGKRLFSSQCKMCHGEQGKGDGDLAGEMNLTVPDFSDAALQKKRTDGELHYILANGHGDMPAQGQRLRSQQMWSMISYIRTLAPGQPADSE